MLSSRSLPAITLTALLATAIALTVGGQGGNDTDGDGVPDSSDNCIVTPNGPLAQWDRTPQCDAQEDGDMDGYGNPCDGDFNQDFGARGLDDVSQVWSAAQIAAIDPVLDNNCDGAVGMDDLSLSLMWAQQLDVAGPSGLSCALTIPCP